GVLEGARAVVGLLGRAARDLVLDALDVPGPAGGPLADEGATPAVAGGQVLGDVPELGGEVLVGEQGVHRMCLGRGRGPRFSGIIVAAGAAGVGFNLWDVRSSNKGTCRVEGRRPRRRGPVSDRLEEWVPRVYRFALRLSNDPAAAEDLTQETFLRAWR